MKLVICSVFDRAVQAFGRPFFVASVGFAIRSFGDEVNRVAPDNLMNMHPDDYDLWELGSFNDSNGEFEVFVPKQLAIGKQLVR